MEGREDLYRCYKEKVSSCSVYIYTKFLWQREEGIGRTGTN